MIPPLLTRLRTEPFAMASGQFAHLAAELRAAEQGLRHFAQPSAALRQDTIGPVDWDGRPLLPQLEIINGVATVQISGALASNVTIWDYIFCGAYDYQWLRDFAAQALASPAVRAFVPLWDSPGGTVQGLDETVQQLEAFAQQKPLAHFTGGKLCSAAYRLALTGEIYAAPSAIIGSIGCVWSIVDDSRMWENNGLHLELFTSNGAGGSADLKALGASGKPTSEADRAFMRDKVEASAQQFRAAVLAARPSATGISLDGGWVDGREALRDRLIDATISDPAPLLAALAA